MKRLYLDHAATSWPKPPGVAEAMVHYLENVGANPARSAHTLSVEAARIVYETREAVAELLGVDDPIRVVFGASLTEGLNLALRGLLNPGDHVITSSMEHLAMMRPLRALESQHIEVTVVPSTPAGELDLAQLEAAIRPETVLIALNHASNVTGMLLPIVKVARLARERDLLLLVDTAQTAGAFPIDMETDGIDLLAFTGHKSLMGPNGTGGLVIGPRVDLDSFEPLIRGGTASRSESEEQPSFLPDRYESGTPNAVGLAGLGAGVGWVLKQGVSTIREKERQLAQQLMDGLRGIPEVSLLGPGDALRQTATVSFTMPGVAPPELGTRLDEIYGILCRVGLHCSPSIHRDLGTFPDGTVRLSPGPFIQAKEIDRTLEAVSLIAKNIPESRTLPDS